MKQFSLFRFLLLPALTLTACGPQAFTPSVMVSNQTAAGGVNLPPRVDILLGVSSDGGMQNIRASLQSQLSAFVQNLESKGWDYRFVSVPMSEYDYSNILSPSYSHDYTVAASRFHTNHGSNWLAPYPGALNTDPFYTLNPAFFNPGINLPSINNGHVDGHQYGLKNQATYLNLNTVKNQILRADANLAVITISNGRDASDGWSYQPSTITYSSGVTSSGNQYLPSPVNVTNYLLQMQSVKANPNMLKYYSVVSASDSNSCIYGPARRGEEYIQAANATGGIAINLCNNTISSALNAIAQNIQSQPLYFKKDHLLLETKPNPATIKVYKNGVLLPEDPTNGWTYMGYLQNQALIFWPTSMASSTGYMIKLNGTATLVGSDSAKVEYMNDGVQASH